MSFLLKQALVAILALAVPAVAVADPGDGYGYGDHMMWGNWVMGPMMMLFMIVVMVVVVVIAMKFFGVGSSGGGDRSARDNAFAILNERFAKGEIDKAEYEERKKALNA